VHSVSEGIGDIGVDALQGKPMYKVSLMDLRPTQLSAGMQQVTEKRDKLIHKRLLEKPKKLDKFLREHPIPVVRGPPSSPQSHFEDAPQAGPLYLIDHHHLGSALLLCGIKEAYVALVDDLSSMSSDQFWQAMASRNLLWCYDEQGRELPGGLQELVSRLPRTLPELKDDPYRSLAALIRKAGGYDKKWVAFAEFRWANFLRGKVPLKAPEPVLQSGAVHIADSSSSSSSAVSTPSAFPALALLSTVPAAAAAAAGTPGAEREVGPEHPHVLQAAMQAAASPDAAHLPGFKGAVAGAAAAVLG